MRILFLMYTIILALLIASNYVKQLGRYRFLLKTINSTGFIVTAAYAALISGHFAYFFMLLPGFLLCLAGDMFLAMKEKSKKVVFMTGFLSFLGGHIAFLLAFQKIVSVRWYDFLFPILMTVLAWRITKMKGMDMQGADIPVLIYAFFVSMLLSKAIAIAFYMGFGTRYVLLAGGSLLFWLSDLLILFIFFYRRKFLWSHFVNLALYYYGLFMLAMSIMY